MKKTRIIFFGSSSQPLPVLQALIDHRNFQVIGVVSRADRPVGRKQILTPNPVSQFARRNKIPLFTPKTQKKKYWLYQDSQKLKRQLAKFKPDLLISAHYGQKIPPEIISLAQYNGLNLHFSLLPKYRGSAPLQWAIYNGEKETGITILKIAEDFDQGEIVAQEKAKIKPTDTSETLYTRLFQKGAKLLIKTIPDYIRGKTKLTKQNNSQAAYCPRLTRDHGFIKPQDLKKAIEGKSTQKVIQIERQIRAFFPWPGTWTKIKLKTQNSKLKTLRLKILKARLETQHVTRNMQHEKSHPEVTSYTLSRQSRGSPTESRYSRLIESHRTSIKASGQVTRLVLDLVQLEGKKPVSFKQFQKAYPNFASQV